MDDTEIVVLCEGDEEAIAEAYKREDACYQAFNGLMAQFLEVGLRLHLFDSNEDWKKLGYRSFYQWAENSDKCPVGHRRAYAAMQVFRLFALQLEQPVEELAKVGEAKFQVITSTVAKAAKQLPEPEAKEEAKKWIDRATTMPKRELRLLVKEEKHKITTLCNRFIRAGDFPVEAQKLMGLEDVPSDTFVFVNVWMNHEEEPNDETRQDNDYPGATGADDNPPQAEEPVGPDVPETGAHDSPALGPTTG